MTNEHSLLVLRDSNIFVYFASCFFLKNLAISTVWRIDNFMMLYYHPDNTLDKNELNLEKGQD